MAYTFKRQPRDKQREAFERFKDAPLIALLFEQRCGKSKVILDIAQYRYQQGTVDALIIVTLNDVHRNWITEEAPQDLHDALPWAGFYWQSGRAATKGYKQQLEELIKFKGLVVLAINIDALLTKACQEFMKKFLAKRKCMGGIDESTIIKNPTAKRTKLAHLLGKRCTAGGKFIATGTPVTKGPLDLFSQYGYLDFDVIGFKSYYAFKHYFAEWEKEYNGSTNTEYEKLVGYRNLDKLQKRIAPISMRVTRDEMSDAPRQIFQKHPFSLAPEQARVYRDLRDEYEAELSTGEHINASMVLTRWLRLQQISSGFFPATGDWSDAPCPKCKGAGFLDDDACPKCAGYGMAWVEHDAREILPPEDNPRLLSLVDELKGYDGKAIVWGRFRQDIDYVVKYLPMWVGGACARYDGLVKMKDRKEQVYSFSQDAGTRWFAGNPHAAGRGLPLHAAGLIIYYSNDFDLEIRLQSQDRAEHLAKTKATDVVDLMAVDTIDEKLVQAHREKKHISDLITGDDPREWI